MRRQRNSARPVVYLKVEKLSVSSITLGHIYRAVAENGNTATREVNSILGRIGDDERIERYR